ncbi:MAG TPA: glutaredoxin family protein [Thermomicrobiales bacterium]|nr:glutaredoxin family protein [Thermomicrobiales bacterium]
MTLLSGPDCSLCAEAERVTRAVFGMDRVRIVSITGNRDLEDEYVFRIPVLMSGRVVLAEGRIDREAARLAHAAARRIRREEGCDA